MATGLLERLAEKLCFTSCDVTFIHILGQRNTGKSSSPNLQAKLSTSPVHELLQPISNRLSRLLKNRPSVPPPRIPAACRHDTVARRVRVKQPIIGGA